MNTEKTEKTFMEHVWEVRRAKARALNCDVMAVPLGYCMKHVRRSLEAKKSFIDERQDNTCEQTRYDFLLIAVICFLLAGIVAWSLLF